MTPFIMQVNLFNEMIFLDYNSEIYKALKSTKPLTRANFQYFALEDGKDVLVLFYSSANCSE
jgi:hypothetical protein